VDLENNTFPAKANEQLQIPVDCPYYLEIRWAFHININIVTFLLDLMTITPIREYVQNWSIILEIIS